MDLKIFYFTGLAMILFLVPVLGQELSIDTTYIAHFKKSTQTYFKAKDYSRVVAYADSLLSKTNHRSNNVKREIYLTKGNALTRLSKWEDAYQVYHSADSLTSVVNREDSIFAAELYYRQGLNYFNLSRYQDAFNKYSTSVQIAEKLYGQNNALVSNDYHNMGSCLQRLRRLDEALQSYETALKIRNKIYGYESEEVAHCYHNMGNCYYYLSNLDLALEHYNNALLVRERLFGMYHLDVASTYNNMGGVFYGQGKINMAAYYMNLAYEIRKKIQGPESLANISSLINLGAMSVQSYNKDKALNYYLEAQRLQNIKGEVGKEALMDIFGGIGSCYFNKGNYDLTLQYYDKVDSLGKVLNMKKDAVKRNTVNRGRCYYRLNDFDNAKKNYYLVLDSLSNDYAVTGTSADKLYAYDGLIKIYVKEDKLDSMNYILGLVEDYVKLNQNAHIPSLDDLYRNTTSIYNRLLDYKSALMYINKTRSTVDKTESKNSRFSDFNILKNNAARQYVNYLNYKSTRDPVYYAESVKWAQKNLEDYNVLKSTLVGDGLIEASEELNYIYGYYLDIIAEHNQDYTLPSIKDSLFELSELSKSNNLYKEFLNKTLISSEEIDEETDITKFKLLSLEKSAMPDTLKAPQRFLLNEKLDSLVSAKNRMIAKSTEFQQKPDINIVPSMLSDDQSVVSYQILENKDDSKVLIFHITKDTSVLYVQKDLAGIKSKIKRFNNSIRQYYTASVKSDSLYFNSLERYVDSGTDLYNILIKPVASQLKKEVTIIPDVALSGFPFGALLATEPKNRKDVGSFHFFESDVRIDYVTSALFLQSLQVEKEQSATEIYAFAPFAKRGIDESENLSFRSVEKEMQDIIIDNVAYFKPLPASKSEVEKIVKLTKGTLFLDEEANISRLLAVLNKDNTILHLATHSVNNMGNSKYSYIAFSDDNTYGNFLSLNDINLLKINSRLIVMSSCESGAGVIHSGEGVIGLTYGLLSAGAKSVISSLWVVDDKATQELMTDFYENLYKGQNTSKALHRAKLSLIQGSKKLYKHPFFWSAFNLYGQSRIMYMN